MEPRVPVLRLQRTDMGVWIFSLSLSLSLSLSCVCVCVCVCSGWLKIYHFGVAKALQEGRCVDEAKFVGSSAGSLICLALALGLDFDRIKEFQLGCVDRTHGSVRGAFKLKQYVDEIMDDMLPDDAYEQIGDRVEISYSALPSFLNRRVNRFRDNDHLRKAVHASCCMSPLCGTPFTLDGDLVYDGAITGVACVCRG
jgi:predicted acylesterase/phospholipase RssA